MMNTKQQGRLDGFFTVKPKAANSSPEKGLSKGKKETKDMKGTKRKVCLDCSAPVCADLLPVGVN